MKYDLAPSWLGNETEFIAWLKKLPAGRRVGYCMDPMRCPVVEWIVSTDALPGAKSGDVSVTADYIRVGSTHYMPPRWVPHVLKVADDVGIFPEFIVTAGRLVEVLGPALESATRSFKKRRGAAIHFMTQGDKPGWKGDHRDE